MGLTRAASIVDTLFGRHQVEDADLSRISSDGLAFVQRSQLAAGAVERDYVGQVTALWDCLHAVPRASFDARRLPFVAHALYRIALGFFRAQPAFDPGPSNAMRSHVKALLLLIRARYTTAGITLAQLCGVLRMAEPYLSKGLVRETHYRFAVHLNSTRFLGALLLLRNGTQIKSIAACVGYASTKELDRQFARVLGASPLLVRACLRDVSQ